MLSKFTLGSTKKKDRSDTSECSAEQEFVPHYLDTRYYDPVGKDTEEAGANGGEPDTASTSLFNFGADRGLKSPFSTEANKRSLVSSFNDLGILNTSNNSQAISKENRNDYILCKPIQKGGRVELRKAIQHKENPECLYINKEEWKASHIVGIFKNLDNIYQCLKDVQDECEWSKNMNAPTPPAKRKPGRQNDTDSHIIGWTHQPRSGGKDKQFKGDMTAHTWIDLAIDEIKRYLGSKSDFPTNVDEDFPDDWDTITKRIMSLCLNIMCHFYTELVFSRLRENNLHTRLNKVFSHALLLNEVFQMGLVNRKNHPLSDLIPILIDD